MRVVEVIKNNEKRYICVDETSGEVIDDAQGYGYKSKQKAFIAYEYKYGDGKKRHIEYQNFWIEHIDIAKFIIKFNEMWFKEIARKEITEDDLLEEIKKNFNISIEKKYLKHYQYAFKKG